MLIFAFLIKILKGLLGELNQQKKRRREKNSSCAVPRTSEERKHAVCIRAADGRGSQSRAPEPSSDSSFSEPFSADYRAGPNATLSAKDFELVCPCPLPGWGRHRCSWNTQPACCRGSQFPLYALADKEERTHSSHILPVQLCFT